MCPQYFSQNAAAKNTSFAIVCMSGVLESQKYHNVANPCLDLASIEINSYAWDISPIIVRDAFLF